MLEYFFIISQIFLYAATACFGGGLGLASLGSNGCLPCIRAAALYQSPAMTLPTYGYLSPPIYPPCYSTCADFGNYNPFFGVGAIRKRRRRYSTLSLSTEIGPRSVIIMEDKTSKLFKKSNSPAIMIPKTTKKMKTMVEFMDVPNNSALGQLDFDFV